MISRRVKSKQRQRQTKTKKICVSFWDWVSFFEYSREHLSKVYKWQQWRLWLMMIMDKNGGFFFSCGLCTLIAVRFQVRTLRIQVHLERTLTATQTNRNELWIRSQPLNTTNCNVGNHSGHIPSSTDIGKDDGRQISKQTNNKNIRTATWTEQT